MCRRSRCSKFIIPRLLLLLVTWVMACTGQAYFCQLCQQQHGDPNHDCTSRRTTEVLTELHTHLSSMPEFTMSESSDSSSSYTGSGSSRSRGTWSGPVPGASGWPSRVSTPLTQSMSGGSGSSMGQGAGIPLARQPQLLPFQPRRPVYSPQQQGSRTFCPPSPRLISVYEYQVRVRALQSLAREYQQVTRRMCQQATTNTSNLIYEQLQLITDQEWQSLGYTGYCNFLDTIGTMSGAQLEASPLYRQALAIIDSLSPEEAVRRQQTIHSGNNATAEENYRRVSTAFFERLMQALQYHTQNSTVVQLTPGWNPSHISTYGSLALPNLIRYFNADYGYSCSFTPPQRLQGRTLQSMLLLTGSSANGDIIQSQPVSGTIGGQDHQVLELLSSSIVHVSHSSLLSLIHLFTSNGHYFDTVVVMSDGNNVWFGSEHLGGYFSPSLREMVRFLSEAFRLLSTLFNVRHCQIVNRYH